MSEPHRIITELIFGAGMLGVGARWTTVLAGLLVLSRVDVLLPRS